MTHYFRNSVVIFLFVGLIVLVASGYSEQPKAVVSSPVAGAAPEPLHDVIARVGDQDISYGQINTMMNSSAVVGLSLPALGTPQRQKVRIMLLDKVISANLLYLDALKQGVDQCGICRGRENNVVANSRFAAGVTRVVSQADDGNSVARQNSGSL